MTKKCSIDYGGQALIEGVMMKSKTHYAMAVRKPDNKISVKVEKLKLLKKGIVTWPFIRGVVTLFEMLVIGIKALSYSANESIGEEEEKLSSWQVFGTILFSLLLAILLFILLPFWLTKIFIADRGFMFDLVDGLLRVIFFLVYIAGISMMKDIRRIFEYHGAEHMTVHCYESGKKLTVQNVKKFGTAHPRCGTTFILLFLMISILVFTVVRTDQVWMRFAARIVLLPVIAGISYEILRILGKFKHSIISRILSWPGMMLQKMTTRQPDAKQIEVAIRSLQALIKGSGSK
ncbi:DUF1385 domain-containing protein [Candidatus Woesearchaeota archaeon]|nr:DUF1385 domain-containing protein [Candidatus Woesearchaeota archaeon]